MEQDISELFLINFIRSLAQVTQISPDTHVYAEPQLHSEETQDANVERYSQTSTIKVPLTKRVQLLPEIASRPRIQAFQQRSARVAPLLSITSDKSASEKINFLIKDPAVTQIECVDSEKELLVKKTGVIQKTSMKLSIEEIYQLIAEFSQKTRIPVIDGTIKAAYNNLVLTAVLSEMLGPRFILQKKNPFQPLVPS